MTQSIEWFLQLPSTILALESHQSMHVMSSLLWVTVGFLPAARKYLILKDEHTPMRIVLYSYCVSDSGTTGILLCSAWQSTWRTGMWPLNSVRLQYASARLTPPQLTKVMMFAEQIMAQRRLATGNTLSSLNASNFKISMCCEGGLHSQVLSLQQ